MRSTSLLFAAALWLGMAPGGNAVAQSWPGKPVTVISAFPPANNDQIIRMVDGPFQAVFKQPLVIENRPGAGGNLGAEAVARAVPDGHTLLVTVDTVATVNPRLYRNLKFKADVDLVPILYLANSAQTLVCHPSVPVKSVADLVKLAKASPGSVNYASAGIATPAHLAGEMLNLLADIKMTHVPYKGAAPALLDVIAGNVQVILTGPLAAGPHMATGKVRALATTGAQRNPSLPELPTIAETVPGYEISQSWGITAPAGTPAPIVRQLGAEMVKVLALPDVRERISRLGVVPATGGADEFAAFITAERKRLSDVIKQAGIVLAE